MVTHADVMIELESIDRDLLDGRFGPAAARAMSLLVRYGSAIGATRFISITAAHIDGCLYHGPSSVEFAERFTSLGGRVRVPTTLDSAAVDVAHPELNHAPPELPVGLPTDATEDELKALGASAAASGSVALFHALHITPEASTIEQAAGKRALECSLRVDAQAIENAIRMLCPLEPGEPLGAMCVGTPHFSRAEFATLGALVSGRRAAPGVEVYVSTSREVAMEIRASGDLERLEEFGAKVVFDTCAYFARYAQRSSRTSRNAPRTAPGASMGVAALHQHFSDAATPIRRRNRQIESVYVPGNEIDYRPYGDRVGQ